MDRTTSSGRYDFLLLIGVSALIFFCQLGQPPLWDRDEPRNAGCAAEMMAASDWIVPIFNAELRTHKPVLLYWLVMVSYSLFGINEFAARFFSALLGVGSVVLTYQIGRRFFGRGVGVWAGVILASTIMFGVAARAATPDSLLIFCSTLAIAIFSASAFHSEQAATVVSGLFPRSWSTAVAIYMAMGLGVLAKGPVGFLLPMAVIGMYLLVIRLESQPLPSSWRGRAGWMLRAFHPTHFLRTLWTMRPLTAAASIGAVAVPWYVWVSIRTDGVWTREFFWTHNVSRATETMEGHSGPPILFYVVAILIGFFPWSILAIPTGIHLIASAKQEASLRAKQGTVLLLAWVGVYIVVFSLSQTKLPSYVTPCYPALAILVGRFAQMWSTASDFRWVWMKVSLATLILVGVGLLFGLPLAAMRFLPGSEWLGLAGAIPVVGGIACWHLFSRQRHHLASGVLATTSVAFSLFLMAVVPTEIGRHRQYDVLFQRTADHPGPIVAFGHLEPSWIFYGKRPIREFGLDDTDDFRRYLQQHANTLVITTPKRIEQSAMQGPLFENYDLLHKTEYFLRDRPLMLIQPRASSFSVAEQPEGFGLN